MHGPETPEARMYRRQEARADLALVYWDLLGGRPGIRLADVGCGPGYFALRLAALTGPTGHLHAVDASAAALDHLRQRLDPVHHAHVTTELLDVGRAPLPPLGFDALLCADMLHHVDEPAAVLRNLRATPARLVIAEYDAKGPGEVGPPLEMRIDLARLVDDLRAAGWRPGPARRLGHEHFALVCEP